MKQFQGKDYLLSSPLAVSLYEKYAQDMPIFDFHCHLSPKEIYEDHHFSSLTEAWLGKNGAGDHYKWRLLRQAGVPEELITGQADDKDRFLAFAKALPTFFGNPIYEWTHLELKRFFGIEEALSEKNAEEIYQRCNEILKDLTARKMMEKSDVKA
ncbi:MAG: glucuronate isomerase, partial [Bacilli bacterium]|nr:glucuronate isomerase [Bacilli bacterium]